MDAVSPAQKAYSDLEVMVMFDMHMQGLDPFNFEDVKKFWEARLPKDDER